MAQRTAPAEVVTAERPGVTNLPAPKPTIVPATDLGGVGVLKHGNIYLLSDAFGDIHPDTRGLGLYDLDTRVPVVRGAARERRATDTPSRPGRGEPHQLDPARRTPSCAAIRR